MEKDHEFCFRLDCPNKSSGTELVLPWWFADSDGAKAEAEITLPFCGIDCLFTFVRTKSLSGIMEQILSTHWHQRRSSGVQPSKAPEIWLEKFEGDPVITKFVIPTSWKAGNSHAIIGLPFSSPEMAASFWQQCGLSRYNLLLYLFEHELQNQEDGPIPATINFAVPTKTKGVNAKVNIPFESLAQAHELWQAHDCDFAKLLTCLLKPE